MGNLFQELKRRNVFRVGVAYLVASWLLLQVADVLAPILSLPDWASGLVFLLLATGFVPALIFAWAYELTPDGVTRETRVDRSKSITHVTGRKLDFSIIAMLVVALIYLVIQNYGVDSAISESTEIERSIAVLPFRSLSNVDEDAFFVDGMHDDLLTQLSRISSLDKVISRTSTERYRDTTKTIPAIGRELGVATILEGGMQRAGSQVRINVQLIDTRTDEHLWARTYDKKLTAENLFEIQTEITREIVSALHGVLSDRDAELLQAQPTKSLAAYEQYTLGRQQIAKRTGEAVNLGKAHFENAVELDPDYALAWVGLADAYALLPEHGGVRPQDTWPARQEALDKALALDPVSGEAYANLGNFRMQQGEMVESEKYFLRAIELNPNYATAYHWYSIYLTSEGRLEESLVNLRIAVELDPLAPILQTNLAATLRTLGRVEEAQAVLHEGIRLNPEFPPLYSRMAVLLVTEGRIAEGLQWARAAVRLNPQAPANVGAVCSLFIMIGDRKAAENCVVEFERKFPDLPDYNKPSLMIMKGEIDAAVAVVEEMVQGIAHPDARLGLAVYYLLAQRVDEAGNVMRELRPEYFGTGELTIDLSNANTAVTAAEILWHSGDRDRADYLFDQSLEFMKTLHRTRGAPIGILDVRIHVIRGDAEQAIAGLREAYDMGWRASAVVLRFRPFDAMQENAEWVDIVELFEADLARQRQWYAEHQNDPLY